MSDVIPFPTRAPTPPEDFVGPAVGADAWACNYCDDDDTKFMFYIGPSGVYCWTCHREQTFP